MFREVASKDAHASVAVSGKVHLIRPLVMTPRCRHDSGVSAQPLYRASLSTGRRDCQTTNPSQRLANTLRTVATLALGWLGLIYVCRGCSGRSDLFDGRCVSCVRRSLAPVVPGSGE